MTVHIGELGQERPQIDADFLWFGTRIRVHPDASDLAYTEFLAIARDVKMDDDGGQPAPGMEQKAASVVDDMLRGQIHPEDWGTFYRLAKENRQTVLDLMALSQRILSAVSGFPTGRPSDSPTGASGGTGKSPESLSGRDSRRKAKRDREKAAKQTRKLHAVLSPEPGQPPSAHGRQVAMAAQLTSGRPDLQLMVMRREEEISAASA